MGKSPKIAKFPQDSTLSQNVGLPLAELDSVYEKWLRSHAHRVIPGHTLRLLDPFTGSEFQEDRAQVRFKIEFQTVKITEPRDSTPKKSVESAKSLEDFENALAKSISDPKSQAELLRLHSAFLESLDAPDSGEEDLSENAEHTKRTKGGQKELASLVVIQGLLLAVHRRTRLKTSCARVF